MIHTNEDGSLMRGRADDVLRKSQFIFKRTEAPPRRKYSTDDMYDIDPRLPLLFIHPVHSPQLRNHNHFKPQTMLPPLRYVRPQSVLPLPSLLPLITTSLHHLRRSYATSSSASDRTSDRVPTNDPQPPPDKVNVSESNAAESGVSALGMRDAPFREEVADAERQRQLQAPNRADVWSRSQQPRAKAMVGPRFEQTIMEYQVSGARGGISFSFLGRREHLGMGKM